MPVVKHVEETGQMSYVGFWLRLGGFIIDGFLLFIVITPLGVWASVSTPWLRAGGYLVAAPFILLGIAFVIGFLYFTLFLGMARANAWQDAYSGKSSPNEW